MTGERALPAPAGQRTRRALPGALTIAAIALLAWPFTTLTPGVGGDWSWVATLQTIAQHGPGYGDTLTFNYGPLGVFTYIPPLLYYGDLVRIAFAAQWALQLLLAGTVYLAAGRSYGRPVAAVLAVAVVAVLPTRPFELGFAWCALALAAPGDAAPGRLSRGFPLAIGALSGVLLLGKLNLGAEIIVLAAIALALRPNRRPLDAAEFAGALAAVAAAGWFATGQGIGDAWPYLRYGAEVVLGYPAYAGAPDPAHGWHYLLALLAFALASALVWAAARRAPRPAGWGLLALWAVYSFGSFKAGFVRDDSAHVWLFMGDMLIALAILPAIGARRWLALGGVVVCIASQSILVERLQLHQLDPVSNAKAALGQTGALISAGLEDDRGAFAGAVRYAYGFPTAFIDRIGRRSIAFWPYSYGELAYAYGLHLRPVPVVEPTVAFTPALDALSAGMLGSADAPELIARMRSEPPSGAGFSFADPPASFLLAPSLSPPLETRALLCLYREVARQEAWQLLARRRSRCGQPRAIETVEAAWGERVPVPRPRPGSALLARIEGAGWSVPESLGGLLLRPAPRAILLGDEPYRLIPSLAREGYLLSVPPDADYRAPFALAEGPGTVAVGRIGGQPAGTLRYTFLELPLDPR